MRPHGPAGSNSVFSDEPPQIYYLYRAALVQWVDSLFYEAGNSRRSHIRVYVQLIRRLCGIGEETFRNYLHVPAESLAGYEPPDDLKCLLLIYVTTRKTLPERESALYLQHLASRCVFAVESARRNGGFVSADILIDYLHAYPKDKE